MIWFRRILTIPLIVSCVALLIILLPVSQLNDTAGNPKFHKDQLRQADIYNFVYDEVLPTGLDELETGDLSDAPVDISSIKNDIVSAAMKILPPDWLQAQIESAIDTILPYLLGDTDRFEHTVVLRDRVETAAKVIKEDIVRGNAFTNIYDDGMSYLADQLFDNLDDLPYSLALTKEEIENSLREVVAEDWVRLQVEAAIDSITPYLTGESNHFTIAVRLRDRVDTAAAIAIDLFSRQETYDYLLGELITPTVETNFGAAVALPFGVSLSREEITSAIEEALPLAWVQERLNDVISSIAAYVKGEVGSIEVPIDLGDRKAIALDILEELADQKLQTLFYSVSECSMWEFLQIVQSLPPDALPPCRPSGVSYDEAKDMLNVDIAGSIDRMIGDRIPDQWVFTDADLRQLLGEGNEDFLDEARNWITEGWTFSDADLIDKLDNDAEETLEDARGWIKSGYTLTETDLREAIADTEEDLQSFDEVRHWTATGRTWLWVAWLIFFLLLLLIGLLGGRNWRSRLAWALVVLFLASLTIYIATGMIHSKLGEPRIQETMLDPLDYEGVTALAVEKGNEVIDNVFNAFVNGIRAKTLYMVIGSGVALLGIVVWSEIGLRGDTGTD